MLDRIDRLRLAGGFAAVALAALITGCNSSNSSPTPSPTATPTVGPTAKGSAFCAPGASPQTTTAPIVAGTNTITSPSSGGCSFAITVSGLSGTSTSATVTTQVAAPAGLATPVATGQGGPPAGFSLPYTPVFYTIITFNGTVGITGTPAEAFTVSQIAPGSNFFSVSWTNAAGQPSSFNAYGSDCNNVSKALAINGSTLTLPACPGTSGGTLPAGSQVVFALAYF